MIVYNFRTPVEIGTGNSIGVTGENKSFKARFLIKEIELNNANENHFLYNSETLTIGG